jgi:hypothetical protein
VKKIRRESRKILKKAQNFTIIENSPMGRIFGKESSNNPRKAQGQAGFKEMF